MDSKPDDIFDVEVDDDIWLGYELDKLNLDNQLDVESALLSVEDNKTNEISSCAKDIKKQNLKESVTDVESDEEQTPETEHERKKDINGNEESSSEENLNQLFDELELSDSDNEAQDDEVSSKLRERAPVGRRLTRRRNRTNYLERNERPDRSQFPPGSLEFLSGFTLVQITDTTANANPITLHSNQSPIFNTRETILSFPSYNAVSSPYPVVYEDSRASSIGSPESGYESSFTGSPPQVSLTSLISSRLDLIRETDDDDREIIDILAENTEESALPGHNVLRGDTDDIDREGKIIEIINYLKDTPSELNESSDTLPLNISRDDVPLVNTTQDRNTPSGNSSPSSGKSSPCLRNSETRIRIQYKLENRARAALKEFLSKKEYADAKWRIYRQIIKDSKTMEQEDLKVIQVVDETEGASENRTNLHHAVLKSKVEEIFALVEIQKQYHKPLSDINIRDRYGKTALDYAIENDMTLVVDYLKENTACQSVNV